MINSPLLPFYPRYDKDTNTLLITLDPSSISGAGCLRKIELSNLLGLRKKGASLAAEFGQAVHLTSAAMYKGAEAYDAIEEGLEYFQHRLDQGMKEEKTFRNIELLAKVLTSYVARYSKDKFKPLQATDGDCAVEIDFNEPFMEHRGVKVNMCGVIDALGTMDGLGDKFFLKDIKTTALYDQDKFMMKYAYSHQMMIYSYIASKIFDTQSPVPVIVDGVFLLRSAQGVELKRSSPIYYNVNDIQTTLAAFRRIVFGIVDAIHDGISPKNPTCCGTIFGDCDFAPLCWAKKTGEIEFNMTKFKQITYDPSKFTEDQEASSVDMMKQISETLTKHRYATYIPDETTTQA